jgi:DNA-binding XRE family transcriptional regulator
MRSSTLESWDGRASSRRQYRSRLSTPQFVSQLSVSKYEQIPEGFVSIDEFLDSIVDEDIKELLPEARRRLGSARRAALGRSERLADIRLEAGLSQDELASMIGTSQPRLSLWEAGREKPSFDCLVRLQKALSTDFNRLMAALTDV